MSTFNVDLTGVTDEWPIVPEGVYNGKVTGMSQYTKADTGNIVFVVDLVITQTGEQMDEKMRYYQTYVVDKPAMSKRNLIRFLRALGVIDDTQTSGDPSNKLKVSFTNGKVDQFDRTEVKAIVVNDKSVSPVGLKCNIVSKPRMIKSTTGEDKMVSSVDSLEPYGAVKKATQATSKTLWDQFPK